MRFAALLTCLALGSCDLWTEKVTFSDQKQDEASQRQFRAKCASVGFTRQQCLFFQKGDEYEELSAQ